MNQLEYKPGVTVALGGECHKALVAALVEAQKAFAPVVKNKSVRYASRGGGIDFRYADLGAIVDAVRGPLADNGLAFVQTFEPLGEGMALRTRLMHVDGGEVNSLLPMLKTDGWQVFGSGATYAKRYSLASLLGVVADDDTDASEVEPPAKPEPKRLFNPPPAAGEWREVDGVLEERGRWADPKERLRAMYLALEALTPEQVGAHDDLVAQLPPAGRMALLEAKGLLPDGKTR